MKILFISTVPVFPPCDGVRIPPAQYIKGLGKSHEVDFLLLDQRRGNGQWEADCLATAKEVGQFWSVPIRQGPKPLGIVRELIGRGPFYGFWELEAPLPTSLATAEYDAVLACTPPAIAIFSEASIRKLLGKVKCWIAAISDIHSLVIARLAQNASKNHRLFAKTVQRLLFTLRSRLLATSEMSMLKRYDWHLVQTNKEAEWIRKKAGEPLSNRTQLLSNAVSDELFTLSPERSKKRIVFVGLLSLLYAGRFEWFIHQVWNQIDRSKSDLSLSAVGRGASDALQETMQNYDVEYVPFVENLDDLYRDHDILIAPIFKGYGLINKVIEAMTAGCLVVGDSTAFNGIPGFVAGEHGLVADTAEDFVRILSEEINDNERTNAIRASARALMEEHFRWSQRIDVLNQQVLPAKCSSKR